MEKEILDKIISYKSQHPNKSIKEIKEELGLTYSLKTIYKKLKQNKIQLQSTKISLVNKNKLPFFSKIFIEIKEISIPNNLNTYFLYSAYDYSSEITVNYIAKDKNILITSIFINYLFFRIKKMKGNLLENEIEIILNKSPEFYNSSISKNILNNIIVDSFNQKITYISFYERKKYLNNIITRNRILEELNKTYTSIKKAKYCLNSMQININKSFITNYKEKILFPIDSLTFEQYLLFKNNSYEKINWNQNINNVKDNYDITEFLISFIDKYKDGKSKFKEKNIYSDLYYIEGFLLDDIRNYKLFYNLNIKKNYEQTDKSITNDLIFNIIKTYFTIGRLYSDLYHYDLSEKYLVISNKIFNFSFKDIQLRKNNSTIIEQLEFKIIKHLSLSYANNSKFIKAISSYDKLNLLFQEKENFEELCKSYLNIAKVQVMLGNYLDAKENFKKALSLSKKYLLYKIEAQVLNDLALHEIDSGDYFNAEIHLLEALKLLKKEKLLELRYYIYGNLSIVYQYYNKYEKSLKLLTELLFKMKNTQRLDYIAAIYSNIATIYFKMENPDRSKKFILKSINLSKKIKDTELLAKNYGILANFQENDDNVTIKYHNLSIKYFKKLNNYNNLSLAILLKIDYLLNLNKILQARKTFDLSNKYFVKSVNIDIKIKLKIMSSKIIIYEEIKKNSSHKIIIINFKKILSILDDKIVTKDKRYKKTFNKELIYSFIKNILKYIETSKYSFKEKVLTKFKKLD